MIVSILQMVIGHHVKFLKCKFLFVEGTRRLKHITMPNVVEIGQSIAEILWFVYFSKWPLPPILDFVNHKFYWLMGFKGSRSITILNLVKIGQSVAKILRFFIFFHDGGHLPSWICMGHIWTTHCQYLVVSINIHNLLIIDAVVSKIWTFQYLARLAG